MTYAELRKKAEELRADGYSYNIISEKIGISKSTLSSWLSHLPYTPNKEVVNRINQSVLAAAESQRKKKLQSRKDAFEQALIDIDKITNRDLFILGLGLYIGEGAKTANVSIANSDVRVIKLMIRWFKECFGISNKQFRLSVHMYPDMDINSTLSFWEHETGIPKEQFGKTQVDKRTDKKSNKAGKQKTGTAHLNVLSCGNIQHGAFLRRRILAQMDIILKSAGVV